MKKQAHSVSENDERIMQAALDLAERGAGLTRPNPPVGAVIVRNGTIVGSGYHKAAGAPHAEAVALKRAGKRAEGADLYVTLEPCSTYGRTPPCTETIINAGVRRVVCAVRDPNPSHCGAGLLKLRSAGIQVVENVCVARAAGLIAPFGIWITRGRPYLTLKLAMSVDGRIADVRGNSRWISSRRSRRRVHELRSRVDAILVGAETVRKDDPSLLPPRSARNAPFRVVVSGSGGMSAGARVFADRFAGRTILATTGRCPARREKAFAGNGAAVWRLGSGRNEMVPVKRLMKDLGGAGLLHVLCEGGGGLAASLIDSDLVDEYLFFLAPIVLGGDRKARAAVSGKGWLLHRGKRLRFTAAESIGDDIMIRAVPEDRESGATCLPG